MAQLKQDTAICKVCNKPIRLRWINKQNRWVHLSTGSPYGVLVSAESFGPRSSSHIAAPKKYLNGKKPQPKPVMRR